MKRLLTIGRSYVVASNRRLAHEMAVAGAGEWEVVAAAPERYAGDLRQIDLEPAAAEACRVVAIPMRGAPVPHLVRYGTPLRTLLRQHWDVVHCWEEPYVAAAVQAARWSPAGATFVFATFQNIRKRYPPPFNLFERRVLRRADGWIAFGRTAHEAHLRRRQYVGVPSRVIPPGVDTGRFYPNPAARARVRRALGWDDETPVAGYLGRFVPEKGLTTMVEALSRVAAPWRALFVGGGPEAASVEAFAAAHPGRVHIATGIPHDEVPAYLNAMDFLCAPSRAGRRWREQFGRMLIEAMACAVPVLASDAGEIPYVVADAGVLLPERQVAAWRDAIERACAGPAWRADLGRRGLGRARAQFDWRIVAGRHLRFFDELLPRP